MQDTEHDRSLSRRDSFFVYWWFVRVNLRPSIWDRWEVESLHRGSKAGFV